MVARLWERAPTGRAQIAALGMRSQPGTVGVPGRGILLGFPGNAIASDVGDASVLGGGHKFWENVVGSDGSSRNDGATVNVPVLGTNANYGTTLGGYDNHSGNLAASAGPGAHHFASGSHSTAGGGSGHVASGQYATAWGGTACISSGDYAFTTGDRNTASGAASVATGQLCLASNTYARAHGQSATASGVDSVSEGRETVASASYSRAHGRESLAYMEGMIAHASGKFAAVGDAQVERYVLRAITTDATQLVAGANGTGGAVQQMQIDAAAKYRFEIVARDTASEDAKAWTVAGLATNPTSGNVVAVGGLPTPTVVAATAGASAWTCIVAIGGDSLFVRVTGEAGKTIRWLVFAEVVELVA